MILSLSYHFTYLSLKDFWSSQKALSWGVLLYKIIKKVTRRTIWLHPSSWPSKTYT